MGHWNSKGGDSWDGGPRHVNSGKRDKPIFRKTTHTRVFQDLVKQIQRAILDGRLKPGDKLPSQRELIQRFQTSRASLREALRVLEQKGLIEVKLGVSGGAVVKDVDTEPITESLALLIQHQKVSFDHLAEFREGVEGLVAALAAERATQADIRRLKDLLLQARAHLQQEKPKAEEFVRVDVQLHIALAQIVGNPIHVAVLQMVHENILGAYERFLLQDEELLRENYEDLCGIVRAIERGEPEKARMLAQSHIRRFNQHMKQIDQKRGG